MRLLVVEDHADSAKAYSLLLSRSGHAVDIAVDMHSALKLCDSNTYDILLADIGLPDGTGWELMQALLKRGQTRGIAVSGYANDTDADKSVVAGFDAHLSKPVAFDTLLATIERISSLPLRNQAGVKGGAESAAMESAGTTQH